MFLIFLFLCLKTVTCARILGIVPTPFYSHQSVFQPIWRELSLRGHQVTVITTNPTKNTSLTNLTEIDISFTHKLIYEVHQMQYVMNTESNILVLMKHAFMMINNMTVEQLQHPEVKELIQSDKEFDLLMIEAHVPAWFGLVKKYNSPVIVMTSMPATNFFKRIMGNINNPVYTHSFNLPFEEKLTFFQRVVSVLFEIFDEFQNSYLLYPIQQRIIREALGDAEINLFDVLKNVSLLFTNEIPGFTKVVTNLPSIVHINGLQIRPPQVLPPKLKQLLDESTSGVIYFSLGSNVKSYLISKNKQDILLGAFKELPFKIVWKFEEEVDNLPENVKVVAWAPQQDILRHPNTKLFITQGGLQSIDEAIRFKVPILGFPFFGDQFYNLIRVKHLQIGSWLDFNVLTKEMLKEAIVETVDNTTFLKNLDEMSDLLAQPLKSLDKAVWWTEYVIKHKGAPHLRSPLADLSFFQYYLFDVIIFLLVVCILITFVVVQLVKLLLKVCCKRTVKVKLD